MSIAHRHFNNLTPAELERLAILSEEMGEAQQAIGKIMRHGYQSCNPLRPVPEEENPATNQDELEKELGDVMFAIQLMCRNLDVTRSGIDRRVTEKAKKIGRYLHHQHDWGL